MALMIVSLTIGAQLPASAQPAWTLDPIEAMRHE